MASPAVAVLRIAVVFVALQGLEMFNEGDHLVVWNIRPEESGPGHQGKIGLGGGQDL